MSGSRRAGPAIEPPEDADPRELAYEVRSQLRTLSKLNAEKVARHLVAAGRLVDEDPAAALQHARAARALGARVAVVREAVGETAYAAGEWTEAIAELRTARRMTGDDSALPMIADAERALGRADRALKIAQSDEARALEPAERAEMRIVEAGARHDLGQLDAALLTLQDFGLDRTSAQPWSARVWYAYADLLLAAGREDEAREWFAAAAGADQDGTTDAEERLLQLDGIEVLTDEDDEDDITLDGAESAPGAADGLDPAGGSDTAESDDDALGADPSDTTDLPADDAVEDDAAEPDENYAIEPIEDDAAEDDAAEDDAAEDDPVEHGEPAEEISAAGESSPQDDEPAGPGSEDELLEDVGGPGGDVADDDETELDAAEDAPEGRIDAESTGAAQVPPEPAGSSEPDTAEPIGTPGAPEVPAGPIVLTFSDQSESGSSE